MQVKQEIEEKLMMEKKYSQMSAALEKEVGERVIFAIGKNNNTTF